MFNNFFAQDGKHGPKDAKKPPSENSEVLIDSIKKSKVIIKQIDPQLSKTIY